jgi:nucleotide-binding universal stress UspA family protein
MKILLAADGSEHTRKSARQLAKLAGLLKAPAEIHLLHVHAPLPFPGAGAAVGKGTVEAYQREESQAALAPAEQELQQAGVAFESHWTKGDVCDELARFVREHGVELVVMGTHGHGALARLALGSVATKAIARLEVPVLVVR